jgi:hypothetical protein
LRCQLKAYRICTTFSASRANTVFYPRLVLRCGRAWNSKTAKQLKIQNNSKNHAFEKCNKKTHHIQTMQNKCVYFVCTKHMQHNNHKTTTWKLSRPANNVEFHHAELPECVVLLWNLVRWFVC